MGGWRTPEELLASPMDPTRSIDILGRLQVRGAVALGAVLASTGLARLIHADLTLPVLAAAVAAGLAWLHPLFRQLRDRYLSLSSDEEEVREVLGDMVSAVWGSVEGIARLDDKGNYLWVNPSYAKMLGFTPEEMKGMPGRPRVHPDDVPRVKETYQQMEETGRASADVTTIRKDDSYLFTRMELAKPLNENARPGFFLFLEDLAESQEIEAALARKSHELVRLNSELEQFAYIAAHDLREPTRKIVSFSALLQTDLGGDLPEAARKDLHFIMDAARRMEQLVHDLLALSRTSRSAMVTEILGLDECVDAALEALALKIEEAGAEIFRDPLPEVEVDRTLITQLYQNLLSNALKFCNAEQPRVHITVERNGQGLVLGVRDNGIGIEPEYAKQIFQPFKRLHGRSEYEGTGIGLAICQKAAERHHGLIWVESEPTKGSHFKFTIGETEGDG